MASGPKVKYPGGVFVWQKQKSNIKCKCGCGEFITNRAAKNIELGKSSGGYIQGHTWKGREMPQSAKDKMSVPKPYFAGKNNPNYGKGLFGEDNPNWQGGKTLLYKKGNHPGANTPKDLSFREKIRRRDMRCVLCDKSERLEVHHMETWVDSVEGRFDPKNCVTLCKSCHVRADNAHHKDRIRPMLEAYIESITK